MQKTAALHSLLTRRELRMAYSGVTVSPESHSPAWPAEGVAVLGACAK